MFEGFEMYQDMLGPELVRGWILLPSQWPGLTAPSKCFADL